MNFSFFLGDVTERRVFVPAGNETSVVYPEVGHLIHWHRVLLKHL
jgi:hypothetical protein